MTSDALGHATSHVALLGAPVAMMILGLDGELLEVNDTLAELLGRSREDLVGRYLHYLATTPEDTKSARAAVEEAAGGTTSGALARCGPAPRAPSTCASPGPSTATRTASRAASPVICLDETRRVLAERRVALSEARFEQSTIPQTTLDLTGRLVDANQAFCQLVDRSLDRLVGRHVRELGDRAEGRRTAALVSRLLAGTVDQVQVERMIRGTNGRPVQVLAHASALTDPSGQRIGAVAYLHDLTALRDVEQRRQQQEDFFLALSQRASDLVIVIDALGQVLYTSPALTGSLGHEPIDVLSEDVLDFIHPDDRATTTSLLEDVVRGAEASTTLRIRDAAGGWRWFEAALGNLLDTVVGGVVCNLRDVTERITAERALRASEARYRAIADSADEGLWVASADGRTLYVNTRLCDILGLDADEVYAKQVGDLVALGREGRGTSRVPPAGSAPSATRRRTPTPTGDRGCCGSPRRRSRWARARRTRRRTSRWSPTSPSPGASSARSCARPPCTTA